MEIEYVTHASLRLSGRRTLLLDPFYFLDDTAASWMCLYPPRDLEPERLGRIDWVFSSHLHSDHCHPPTLQRLKPQLHRVLLPAGRTALRERYEQLGLRDLTLLENGVTTRLDDGLAVTCFWSDPVDSVLVVEQEGTVVVHQNDARLDDALVRQIGERFRVDWAFLCYTMAQDLFPLLLDRPAEELDALAREREEQHFAYNLRCVEAWQPRAVVPYSMAMTYFDPAQQHLNGHGRLVPAEFCARLRAARPGTHTFVVHPGDVIDAGSGALREHSGRWRWGESLAQYLTNVAAWVEEQGGRLPRFAAGDATVTAPRFRAFVEDRLAKKPPPRFCEGKRFAFRLTGGAAEHAFTVDLATAQVSEGAGAAPLVEFTLPASVAEAVIGGRYDPFEVLFSYRVSCRYGGRPLPAREESMLIIAAFAELLAPEALALTVDDVAGLGWIAAKAARAA